MLRCTYSGSRGVRVTLFYFFGVAGERGFQDVYGGPGLSLVGRYECELCEAILIFMVIGGFWTKSFRVLVSGEGCFTRVWNFVRIVAE